MAERISIADLEGTTCIVEDHYCLDEASETLSYRHLRFAFESLEGGKIGEKGRADAITWAKRALDARLGLLLSAMGFDPSRMSVPDRVLLCAKAGILAPRILLKLNRLRNTVEHEFSDPPIEAVEDFVDVAGLFIYGTERLVREYPTEFEFEFRDIQFSGSEWFEPFVRIKATPRAGSIAFAARILACLPDEVPISVADELEEVNKTLPPGKRDISPLDPYRLNLDYVLDCDDPEYLPWLDFLLHRRSGEVVSIRGN